MKKLITLCLSALFSIAVVENAHADYVENYAKIECMPEFGIFEVTAITIHDNFIPESKELYKQYKEKYGLQDSKRCKIGDDEYTIKAAYTEPQAKGVCGAATKAVITIYQNDKLLYEVKDFHSSCADKYGPRYISFRWHPSIKRLTICPMEGTTSTGCEYKDLYQR